MRKERNATIHMGKFMWSCNMIIWLSHFDDLFVSMALQWNCAHNSSHLQCGLCFGIWIARRSHNLLSVACYSWDICLLSSKSRLLRIIVDAHSWKNLIILNFQFDTKQYSYGKMKFIVFHVVEYVFVHCLNRSMNTDIIDKTYWKWYFDIR